MHGWKHWLLGAGFFGFGVFKLMSGGSPWLVGLCVVASGYLFYRALMDQTGAAADDLQLAVDFVQSPYETLFDQAVEQLSGAKDEPEPERRDRQKPGMIQSLIGQLDTREEKSSFDPDAAIARYLANRPALAQSSEPAPLARTHAGFGRKRA